MVSHYNGCVYFQLFLLQMDDIMTNVAGGISVNNKPTGCTSICLNEPGNVSLKQTLLAYYYNLH